MTRGKSHARPPWPVRMCVICRERFPKSELVRHVATADGEAGLAPDPEDAEAPQTILSPTASWTQPSLFGEAPMAENVEPPKASAKIVSLRLEPRAPRPARAPAQAATPATPDLLDTIPPGPSTRLRRLRAAQFTPEELSHLRSLQARMSALHERLSPARR